MRVVFWALYVFSLSRFHVPQGRSKIAQRFIAGLWRERKTSPVRDERTHQSHLFCRPDGALAILQSQPTVETVGYFRSSLSGLSDPCFFVRCCFPSHSLPHLQFARTKLPACRTRLPIGGQAADRSALLFPLFLESALKEHGSTALSMVPPNRPSRRAPRFGGRNPKRCQATALPKSHCT